MTRTALYLRISLALCLLPIHTAFADAASTSTGNYDNTSAIPAPQGESQAGANGNTPKPLDAVSVVGSNVEQKRRTSSVSVIEAATLRETRALSVVEALRKVPGINVRDEEGFGIRPNIGIRGLNPTRSTKVLLLEDGIPASYAPYGDNASYYHAPVDRFDRIEVLKGVEMLRYGPQSIGGVINYRTPDVSQESRTRGTLASGSRGYLNAHGQYSGAGFMVDAFRKQGDGNRDNTVLRQSDFNMKYQTEFADAQRLSVSLSYLQEDSEVGYTGITDAERANFGSRYNPFERDQFLIDRYGGSIAYQQPLGTGVALQVKSYAYRFERDWWRQSSATTDTQCGTAFRDARIAGVRVNPNTCNSVQGRLRNYDTYGVEPSVTIKNTLFGADGDFEFGVRLHRERQERRQVNGLTPDARMGTLAEDNRRNANARSAFVSQRMQFEQLSVFPIVRFESADFDRQNRLTVRAGKNSISEVLPGLGLSFAVDSKLSIFASGHKGYNPPRVEDLIDNNGTSVEVDAEDTRQIELGVRAQYENGHRFEISAFQNRFLNQLSVGSIAGGGVPLAQGQTLYRGLELSHAIDFNDWIDARVYLESALTWLPTARQESALRAVSNQLVVAGSVAGKRLPYAPKHLASVRLGLARGAWDSSIEAQHIGRQFADFANVEAPTGNGQFGAIGGSTVLNATVNWAPEALPVGLFLSIKNLTDRVYVSDRTRGLLFGLERHLQLGIEYGY